MTARRVTCAVMLADGKVLLARRAPDQKNAGLWEFPGGKVETGESDRACLEREIWEELGIRGQAGEHLCDSAFSYGELSLEITLCAYLFIPESWDFQLRVHDAIRCFAPQELDQAALSPADIPIARRVRALIENNVGGVE